MRIIYWQKSRINVYRCMPITSLSGQTQYVILRESIGYTSKFSFDQTPSHWVSLVSSGGTCWSYTQQHYQLDYFNLSIPQQIWEYLSMDFTTGLIPSNTYIVILVVMDSLSKYSYFTPLKTDYKSYKVAEVFLHKVVNIYSLANFGNIYSNWMAQRCICARHKRMVNIKLLTIFWRFFTSQTSWSKLLPLADFW